MTTNTALALLAEAQIKLRLYRAEHSGVYVGGMEFTELDKRITALLGSGGWQLQDDIPNLDAMSVFHKDIGKPIVTRNKDGKWYVHQPLPPLPKGE